MSSLARKWMEMLVAVTKTMILAYLVLLVALVIFNLEEPTLTARHYLATWDLWLIGYAGGLMLGSIYIVRKHK